MHERACAQTRRPSGAQLGIADSGPVPIGTHRQPEKYLRHLGGFIGPQLIDQETVGHQLFPDISADHGSLHALWWDSRKDPAYSPARPIGNDSTGHVYDSLDVYASTSTTGNPGAWTTAVRVTDKSTNPNYEQFGGRTVPFAGATSGSTPSAHSRTASGPTGATPSPEQTPARPRHPTTMTQQRSSSRPTTRAPTCCSAATRPTSPTRKAA